MLTNKLLKLALLGGAILTACSSFAQQDSMQALLDLLVKKGVVSTQEADSLKAQAQANAAAAAQAAPSSMGSSAPMPAGAVATVPGSQSPLSFRIGSADFTPLGFMDFTGVYRSTLNGGDIGSSFGSFPYSNNASGQLSETRFSTKNSRLGLRIDSTVGDWKVLGYVETDFLGNAATNVNVASNSDVMRMRVFFVDLKNGQWEFLAGQDLSMMTPNRKGISPIPGDIFYSQDVDTNYQVGLVWGRTPQVRAVYHATDEWTFGISAENPDQYVGSAVVLPSNFTATQVDQGANGTATPNVVPDIIAKMAFDTKFGNLPFHADMAGLYRDFRVNTFVPATGINADSSATGYGGSFNMNISLAPNFQLIENAFASKGGGRYISTGLGPDFVVTPPDAGGVDDIALVYSYADILGFEWDAVPATKIYGYYGSTHFGSRYMQQANGSYVGYGYAGSANTNNKLIEEYTLGLAQILWKSPTAGDLKFLAQYSYLDRDPWYVAAATPSSAHINMFYVDLRYDLP
jgi:hypothetical protein